MKKLHISMAGERAVNGYLFILPWLLGFLLFYVRSLYISSTMGPSVRVNPLKF